jgi:hypothetical protein
MKTIGNYAFRRCASLSAVDFGHDSQLTAIGTSAFNSCVSLNTLAIPAKVTTIGSSAFYETTALTAIYFNAESMNDLGDNNSVFYNSGKNASGITVTVGAGVTKIPVCLFDSYNMTDMAPKIKAVEFAAGGVCQSIGNYAFAYCAQLQTVALPDSITIIGIYAFRRCTSLSAVNFGNDSHLTTIGASAFNYCASLNTLTIPAKVTTIGNNAFSETTALTAIYFNAVNMNDLGSNNNVFTNAGKNADGITVSIGAGVTKIPVCLFDSYDMTDMTPKIKTVEFAAGSTCQSIGSYAFAYCGQLQSVTLPESVATIGNYAFRSCASLSAVTIGRSAAKGGITVLGGSSVFYYCNSLADIYVPDGESATAYKAAANWSAHAPKISVKP